MKQYGNRIKQSQTIDNGETRRDWRRDKKKIERDRDRERERERERKRLSVVGCWAESPE